MSHDPDETRGLWPPLYMLLHLPSGMNAGFVSVTLGYVLAHHGFSVAAIAGMISLSLLPATWRFVMGPIVDLSLTPKLWYVICAAILAVCMVAFAFVPLRVAYLPVIDALALAAVIAANAGGGAVMAAMATIEPVAKRGVIGGWAQAGGLSGNGLGGGAGLWLVSHTAGGLPLACFLLAGFSLFAAWPMLRMRIPARALHGAVAAKLADLGRGVVRFGRTRSGVLAILAVTVPCALNASGNLFPAVAGDWRASADLVAAVTGVLAGLISLPGCVVGGYLCGRFPPRKVMMSGALACALGQIAMALAPHTPAAFAGFILGNTLIQGVAWGALTAVIYECLGRTAAATLGTVLGSLANVPLVAMTLVVGPVQTRHGSTVMLLTEAGIALVSVAAYSLLAWLWKPQGAAALDPALQTA